jgi:hypothetical protein
VLLLQSIKGVLNMDVQTLETITRHYLVCALWSSMDDDTPMDETCSIDDVSPDVWKQAREDVGGFVALLEREGVQWSDAMSPESFGHDFWLTRNGHGVGFWDRGLGELGDTLTTWASSYGTVYLYVGDDGMVYG